MQAQGVSNLSPETTSVLSPRLPAPYPHYGAQGEAQWILKSSFKGTIPIAGDESLFIQVALLSATPERSAVRLYTNLNDREAISKFSYIELSRDASGVFTLQHLPTRCGRFVIYGQYTLDGENWRSMRGAPLFILVYPPQIRGMRLYTWIPNANGPLHDWPQKLDHVQKLGFTMVHLLPLTKMGESLSPYAAADLFALDPWLDRQTDEADSKLLASWHNFVSSAQTQKVGLCIDLVLNHVAIDSELATRCPHWIMSDENEADGLKRAGFLHSEGWHAWRDLVLIQYDHPDPETKQAIWSYMEAYTLYWAGFAAQTGGLIRLDNLHSTPPNFARFITQRLRTAFPNLGILGEFFGSTEQCAELLKNCDVDLLLATPWEHHFAHELRNYLSYLHNQDVFLPWFCPVNTHDSGTPAQEFLSVSATQPRYFISACLGTGATGMSQGVEQGLIKKANFIGRNPQLSYAPGVDFEQLIRRINMWLAECQAFQQGAMIKFVDQNHPAIIAALRYTEIHENEPSYLVLANLDIHNPQDITISLDDPKLIGRDLYELFSEQVIHCRSHLFALRLEPCGVRLIRASVQHVR